MKPLAEAGGGRPLLFVLVRCLFVLNEVDVGDDVWFDQVGRGSIFY